MINPIHGGDLGQYIGKGRLLASSMIDFSANINPLGLSARARRAVIANIDTVTCYPEADSGSLKQALGKFHKIGLKNLTVGNGSIELIYLIPQIAGLKKAFIVTPSFSEYEIASRINKISTSFFNTNEIDGFKINIDDFNKSIPKESLVYLGNPNNPTGIFLSDEEVLYIASRCKRQGSILILDQAFVDFSNQCDREKLIVSSCKNRSLLLIRSLTKFFALPGLRIGYCIGHQDNIGRILKAQYPWNVNSLAQAAAKTVLTDSGYILKSVKYILKEREYLVNNLGQIKGLIVYSSNSNFLLCKLVSCRILDSGKLSSILIKRGLAIRNCANFRGLNSSFFRLAVRKRKENVILIQALKEVL